GVLFEDVNGLPAVASLASRRASELLAAAREIAPGRAAFALEGASELVVTLLGQRLTGWERAPDGPAQSAVWLGPRSGGTTRAPLFRSIPEGWARFTTRRAGTRRCAPASLAVEGRRWSRRQCSRAP